VLTASRHTGIFCNDRRKSGKELIGNTSKLGLLSSAESHQGAYVMANSPDVTNIPGMTKEMRDGVVAAFDAMSCWRDEIESVNARCAGKVLDQMSATARAMGWSEQAVAATREYLAKASKMQTEVLDQLIDGWKRQLKSPVAPTAIPRCFTAHCLIKNVTGELTVRRGAAIPNRIGVADGGTNEHGRAARDQGGGG
jgi:hypothetical protein